MINVTISNQTHPNCYHRHVVRDYNRTTSMANQSPNSNSQSSRQQQWPTNQTTAMVNHVNVNNGELERNKIILKASIEAHSTIE